MQYLKGKAAVWGARLLSVSRQVGANMWYESLAGGLSGTLTHDLLTLSNLKVQALPLRYLLVLLLLLLLLSETSSRVTNYMTLVARK